MQDGFEIERQRHEREPLRGERADGGQRGQREHGPAEQVDRQHRRRVPGLAADQQPAERECHRSSREHDRERPTLREFAEREDQRRERDHVEQRGHRIERMLAARRLRQRRNRDCKREHAERHVHREQPRPRGHRQDQRRDRRPHRERHADDERVEADAAPEPVRGKQAANQRDVDAHDRARAEALHDARGRQHRQRRRERTTERRQREHRQPGDIHALVTDDVAERCERQQRRDHRELVRVDDPHGRGRRRMQVGGDRGQRGVRDRGVEGRERDGQQHGGHRAPVDGRLVRAGGGSEFGQDGLG